MDQLKSATPIAPSHDSLEGCRETGCRETAQPAPDPHDLAWRGRDKKEITRLLHQPITDTVELHSGDDLLDIGWGDGVGVMERRCQWRSVPGARFAVGLLASDEEVAVRRRFGLEAK